MDTELDSNLLQNKATACVLYVYFVSHMQACLVHTTETIRIRYFMDRLLEHRRPVMLVGNAGTGKSVLVGDKLGSLDAEKYMIKNVPFNYYTTSAMLQGRNYPFVIRDISLSLSI